MLLTIKNPASRLPVARRFIGFSKARLFSLMYTEVEKRGGPVSVRIIVRVL